MEKDLLVGITSGSRRRGHHRQRWTIYWWTLTSALQNLQPCAEIVTHGDSSFKESPEFGDNLVAHRESPK